MKAEVVLAEAVVSEAEEGEVMTDTSTTVGHKMLLLTQKQQGKEFHS